MQTPIIFMRFFIRPLLMLPKAEIQKLIHPLGSPADPLLPSYLDSPSGGATLASPSLGTIRPPTLWNTSIMIYALSTATTTPDGQRLLLLFLWIPRLPFKNTTKKLFRFEIQKLLLYICPYY